MISACFLSVGVDDGGYDLAAQNDSKQGKKRCMEWHSAMRAMVLTCFKSEIVLTMVFSSIPVLEE